MKSLEDVYSIEDLKLKHILDSNGYERWLTARHTLPVDPLALPEWKKHFLLGFHHSRTQEPSSWAALNSGS